VVKIITDTTACLSPEIARHFEIPIIPQIINFGNESFYEGTQIDTETFLARLKTSKELPKTAAPPPDLFTKEFERLVPLGEPILCIHPSMEVSGTVRSALVAKQDFPDADIRVIDTRTVATPLGTMVELCANWAEEGLDADVITTRLDSLIRRCRVYFLVATLDYLARGGRIGGAAHLLGSVLQIKPILALHDGKVDQYERERTHKRAVARLKEIVCEQAPLDGTAYLTVMHSDVPEEGQALADDLARLANQAKIPIANVPPAIVTHGGPGILGVGFFVKE
jgi:DegV family protein with EDD domain